MQPVFLTGLSGARRTILLAAAVAALIGVFAKTSRAEVPSQYDLPADEVVRSLKRFSHQSGRGVIVGADDVNAVWTHAVKGQLTAEEALTQMLAGTGLVATQDERNGAFAVRRESAGPNAPRAAQ